MGTRLLRSILVLSGAAMTCGCSGSWYRDSADRQVYQMIAKRQEAVLDYRPDATVAKTADVAAPKKAYEKIPATPVPPPAQPPLAARVPVDVPYGPLGPDAKWIGVPVPEGSPQKNGGAPDADLGTPANDPFTYGPPAPRGAAKRFDLFQSVAYGVQHSRQYQGQVEDLYLSALDVTLQRHLLSPRPFAKVGAEYTGGQKAVEYRSALAVTGNAGVRQRLPYGGEVVAETLVRFVNALNDNTENGEEASVALSGSLPLLRGAGMVNLDPLISAERDLVYTVRAFEDFRRSFAVNVSRQYFDLLARQQAVRNRQLNYQNLAVLTERTRALFGAGLISFLEVQRSEQALLQAEAQVVRQRESYQNALDQFKILLGMPVSEDLAVIPVDLDLRVPDLNADNAVATAMRYRLDLQTARDRINDAKRGIEVARNGLLPALDLTASGQATNPRDDPARKLNSRTLTYSAGVTLDLPVDWLPQRNVYRRALITYEQSLRTYDGLQDTVAANVMQDIRSIRSAEQSLRIQQESIALAQRRLDLASQLLKMGGAGGAGGRRGGDVTRDVVDAQQSLLLAQDEYEQARAELQVQVLQFLRDTGTLRVDPDAGLIGRAMWARAGAGGGETTSVKRLTSP